MVRTISVCLLAVHVGWSAAVSVGRFMVGCCGMDVYKVLEFGCDDGKCLFSPYPSLYTFYNNTTDNFIQPCRVDPTQKKT